MNAIYYIIRCNFTQVFLLITFYFEKNLTLQKLQEYDKFSDVLL